MEILFECICGGGGGGGVDSGSGGYEFLFLVKKDQLRKPRGSIKL